MYGYVAIVVNIRKTLIPCAWVLGILNAQNMHEHPIHNLGLAICLGVEDGGFGELVSSRDQRLNKNVLRI
jgi:hypothetical protein